MGLKKYKAKRNFKITSEPQGAKKKSGKKLIYVIQKHNASHLHYDFRLEYDGTLKSWAVPKGPSLNPKDKRLAVEVEDHPIDYATFEGDIPKGQYGGGHVEVWDFGFWTPPENIVAGLKKGHIDFELHGKKLRGHWSLIRLRNDKSKKNNWLLIKKQDEEARSDYDIISEEPESVLHQIKPAKKSASKKKRSAARSGKKPPPFVSPQLAQLVDKIPEGGHWIHEIKYDGYRTLCRIDHSRQDPIELLTRKGLDWTSKYGPIKNQAAEIPVENALLDGEIVWVDEKGHTTFQGLQDALSNHQYSRMIYYVFDLLFLNGEDLRKEPLLKRKQLLKTVLSSQKKSKIIYSDHFTDQGEKLFRQSCRLHLEGIISKNGNQPYFSGRSDDWQKNKCELRQEFVIGGYAESKAKDRPFAALLMGVYDNDELRYVGKIGTGFSIPTLQTLKRKLADIEIDKSPFDIKSPRERNIHWVKPKLVAEIEFKAWTGDGMIRQGSFQGLRSDKESKEIHEELPVDRDLKITHPQRIVFKKTKTKKEELIQYYQSVYPRMKPFLHDRPLSVLRCQENTSAGCFFQKHAENRNLDARSKEVHYKDKRDKALIAETQIELLKLIQAGTVEIHAWGANFTHITTPDLMVFDLDPESLKLWSEVVETAHHIRDVLQRLKLQSFVKVTGGKGLHIQVPILPLYSWDEVKNFSRSLMQVLEDESPQKYTLNMNKNRRNHKIFLDYLRNGYGATAVLPYSVRARETPTIAVPIAWRDLKPSLQPNQFTIEDIHAILKRKDPWTGYGDLKQKITLLENKSFAKSSHAHQTNWE